MYLVNDFFLTLITFDWKTIIPNRIWIATALKIAKILAEQASAQPFQYNSGASAIASKIVAAQVPTFGFKLACNFADFILFDCKKFTKKDVNEGKEEKADANWRFVILIPLVSNNNDVCQHFYSRV